MDQSKDPGGMKFRKIRGNANHHLFWRGQRLWVRFFKTGKGTLEKSLNTTEVGLARIRRDEQIAKFLGVAPKWRGSTLLVEDKFPEFVEMKKVKAPRTYASIKAQWELHLKPHFGGMRVDDISETEWIRYVSEKRKVAPRRKFFNDRKYLSMFLNWLHRSGVIKTIPRLEDVDPETNVGKVYSDAEISRILANAGDALSLHILMALTMGMRKGEIITLEWSQIDFDAGTIYLPAEKTKIRKERTFAMSGVCSHALLKLHGSRGGGWVFPNREDADRPMGISGNQTAWETCKERAAVEGRFHDLRHTFLTKAFKQSVNPALICEYAGLSMEEAQKTYLHFKPEDTKVVSTLVPAPTGGIL